MRQGSDRRRVLAVNRVDFLGGVERVLLTAAQAVAAHGWTTVLACPPGQLADQARRSGVPVRQVDVCRASVGQLTRSPLAPGRIAGQILRVRRDLLRMAQAEEVGLIHVHHPVVALQARHAARALGAPLLWHVHETAPAPLAYRGMAAAVAASCDLFVCVSDASRRMVREFGVPEHKIRLVYNAVEPRFFAPIARAEPLPGEGPHIGAFGVLEPRKGHADLIRACAALAVRRPGVNLWIVGGLSFAENDSYLRALKKLAADLNIAERVHFMGHRQDIPQLMARMDAVALASTGFESLPTVLIEAAAVGAPIVGADVGGVREIIQHQENGLVVSPGRSAELAAALDLLLSPAGAAMARRAKADARRRFSPARFAAELADCYAGLTQAERVAA